MSQQTDVAELKKIEFEPILPESGILFYEECPTELVIELPKILPLKTPTQIRYEQIQQEAIKVWKDQQKDSELKK